MATVNIEKPQIITNSFQQAADRLQQLSEKQTPCPACKGKDYITLTRKFDDRCGVGNEVCTYCGGVGMLKTAITRSDRFRSMSDEELVTLAMKQIGGGYDWIPCGTVCNGKCECASSDECKARILEWLRQPVEVE